MPITAAQLEVKVTGNTLDAETKLAALSAQNKAFMTSAAGVHSGALIAMAGIAAIGVAAGLAVNQAAGFQTQLTQLVTGAGESADKLGQVRAGILALAPAVGQSTDQLTAGMYMIESAGYHGADGLVVLKNAAMGAKVGAADLGTVADATTTLMTDFGIKAGDSAQAVNALIATVANGKTHMQDLGQSLAEIAPTASAAHVSLNDMLGAMATMTGEGVPAANAATYLRQMIISLNAPSSEAKSALKAIGLTSDQVASAMRESLPSALQLIQQHLAQAYGEGSPKYVEALKSISGGVREMQGMLDLTGTHLATFGANVDKISTAVKTGGSNITGWDQVQGTFNQKMSQAGAAVQVLAINIGTVLLPPLTNLVGAVTPVISKFADWVSALSKNHDLMNKLAPVAQILAGVLGGVLVAALVSLAVAGWGALAPFLAFAAPFILIGGLAAALVVGLNFLGQKFGWWKSVMDPINGALHFLAQNGDMVKTVLLGIAAGIAVVVAPILAGLVPAFIGWAVSAGLAAIATIAAALPVIAIIAGITLLVVGIKLLIDHWSQVSAFLGGVWKFVVDQVQQGLHNMGAVFSAVGGAIGAVIGWVGDQFHQGAARIGVVIGVIVGVFKDLASIATNIWNGIVGAVKGAINQVIDGINGFIGFIDKVQIHIPAVKVGPLKTPAFDWNGLGIPKIPHLATGGAIAGGGLALVGEQGPEIVTLPAGANVLPAGTSQQLLAGAAAGGQSPQTQTIIIQLDGRVLAQATVKHLPTVIRLGTGARSF